MGRIWVSSKPVLPFMSYPNKGTRWSPKVDYWGAVDPDGTVTPWTRITYSVSCNIDTGNDHFHMPETYRNLLYSKFFPDVPHTNTSWAERVDCKHRNDKGSLRIGFNAFYIDWPIRSFVREESPGVCRLIIAYDANSKTGCDLSIHFLKAAYGERLWSQHQMGRR
jgi:hypothetical protein